ncbi:MAG: PP2C family protein-serine/threonine phosphatase [Phycisphaerales bacterium JB054]
MSPHHSRSSLESSARQHDPIPPEFLARYDAERASLLRRRAIWYCIIVLALVAHGWGTMAIDLAIPEAFPGSPETSAADIVFHALFGLAFARALIYFARKPRSRPEIVRAFQWLLFFTGLTGAVVIALLRHASWSADSIPLHTADDDLAQGIASLVTLLGLHFIASLLVALSPREGLVPMLPVMLAFIAWVLFASVGPAEQKAWLIGMTPVAIAPGIAWGWWRYRSFSERFHARAIRQRYAEVTRELTDARRVHEALFPPPVTRGRVRIRYTYEPMRSIGGDFLFVRPLAFPPSATEGPTLVVLIDVTGHGIAAAIAVNRLHAELERLTAADPLPSPAAVITGLNTFTCAALAPQSMFATAFCLRITPDTTPARITWAGAGHPPAYLRSTTAPVRLLDSTAPMLGVIDADLFTCDEGELPLSPGDAIVALTDGAIEATDNNGNQFGIEGIRQAIAAADPNAPLPDAITAAVEAHIEGPARDDMLIVEIALNGPQAT